MTETVEELKAKLEAKLRNRHVSGRVLLDRFQMLDPDTVKLHGAYSDPSYMPFYLHLGRFVPAPRLLEFGFGTALASGCFCWGNGKVQEVLGFQPKRHGFYSARLGIANLSLVFKGRGHIYVGQVHDQDFVARVGERRWDVALVSDRESYDGTMTYLEAAWTGLEYDGLLCVDNLTADKMIGRAFADFCKIKNRPVTLIGTRYGVGLVKK